MKNRSVFFYIIVLLALAAVAGLVFFLAPGSKPDTPPVLLPTPGPTDPAPDDAAAAEWSALAVTPDTVQTVIATLQRIDSYSRTLSVRDFWSGGSRSRTLQVWVRGDAMRLEIQSEGHSAREELLLRDGKKWIWYSDADGVYIGAAAEGDADAYQTILTYEKLLDMPKKDILEAGFTEFSERYCIYVRCRTGTLGYISECYIDPDTGLLMGERCYDGEALIYFMDSTLPDVSTPDDAVFAIP